jgi:hypothetical protein
MILCGCAQHCRTTDIDVLDGICAGAVFTFDRRFEGIQVNDQQIDRADVVFGHGRGILIAARENAAMDLRVQSLYPTVHDLGEARDLRYVGDGDLGRAQRRRSAAGG